MNPLAISMLIVAVSVAHGQTNQVHPRPQSLSAPLPANQVSTVLSWEVAPEIPGIRLDYGIASGTYTGSVVLIGNVPLTTTNLSPFQTNLNASVNAPPAGYHQVITTVLTMGTNASLTLSNLTAGQTYYATARSYLAGAVEGNRSAELQWVAGQSGPQLLIWVSEVSVSWYAMAKTTNQLQFRRPDETNWHNLGAPIVGSNAYVTRRDGPLPGPGRLYRLSR